MHSTIPFQSMLKVIFYSLLYIHHYHSKRSVFVFELSTGCSWTTAQSLMQHKFAAVGHRVTRIPPNVQKLLVTVERGQFEYSIKYSLRSIVA